VNRIILHTVRTRVDPDEPEGEEHILEDNVSMQGRRLRAVGDTVGGEVGSNTIFGFSQEADLVWVHYAGGQIRLGFMVGTSSGTLLDFRYTQISPAGWTSTGHSNDRIECARLCLLA
jgi:hypothetical protein